MSVCSLMYGLYYGLTYGTAKAMVGDLVPDHLRGTAYEHNTILEPGLPGVL